MAALVTSTAPAAGSQAHPATRTEPLAKSEPHPSTTGSTEAPLAEEQEQPYVTSRTARLLHEGAIGRLPHRTAHLPRCGMTVTFAELGDAASPHVVFFNHGIPGCRIFEGLVLDGEAQRAGLRLVAVERPGFGRCPFNPRHSVAGWADVILELADTLQVQQFSVMGASGGGPFTAACGRFIPRERLVAIGLVCPLGTLLRNPPAAAVQRALLAARFLPPRLSRLAVALVRTRIALDRQYFLKHAHHPVDRASLQQYPELGTAMQASFVEALKPGPAGLLHTLDLLHRPWGFDLRTLDVSRVYLWHGLRDDMVPHASASLYERIPGCKTMYLPDDAHISIGFSSARMQMETMKAAHKDADAAGTA